MIKLGELRERYLKHPVLLLAITSAINVHGADADCTLVSGQPSFRKGSNCRKAADFLKWTDYVIYSGPKRRYKTEGFVNVLVGIK